MAIWMDVEELMEEPSKNMLYVGLSFDECEVVINHPQLLTDKDGNGYLTFSPDQARNLGKLLLLKASQCRAVIPGR